MAVSKQGLNIPQVCSCSKLHVQHKSENLRRVPISSIEKPNKACLCLWERLVKGKSKKIALIAVVNKCNKQSFVFVKSGLVYDEEFRSVNPIYLKNN